MDYIDPELLLTSWVTANLPANAGTNLDDLEDRLPLVCVNHIGGADDLPTLSDLSIDFGFYAANKAQAGALARPAHDLLRKLRGTILTHDSQSATVTDIHTGFLPRPDDSYGNPAVFRYLANYAITFKPRRAT